MPIEALIGGCVIVLARHVGVAGKELLQLLFLLWGCLGKTDIGMLGPLQPSLAHPTPGQAPSEVSHPRPTLGSPQSCQLCTPTRGGQGCMNTVGDGAQQSQAGPRICTVNPEDLVP